jgi:hypothetical protein
VLGGLPEYLRQQWEDGDWDAIPGRYFEVSPDRLKRTMPHGAVRDPETEIAIPEYADWYGGVDWGRSAPFACVWIARWRDINTGAHHGHIFGELRRKNMHLDEQARAAMEVNLHLRKKYPNVMGDTVFFADPATGTPVERLSSEVTRTQSQVWADYGFFTRPAFSRSRIPGWQLIRQLLRDKVLTIDPQMYGILGEFSEAQYEGGETPVSEDLDTTSGNIHSLDALRYVVNSTFALDYVTLEEDQYERRLAALRDGSFYAV